MYRKTIDEAGFEEVKVKFYALMVEYYSHEKDCWEICQCFYKVSEERVRISFLVSSKLVDLFVSVLLFYPLASLI